MRVEIAARELAKGTRFYVGNPDDLLGPREYLLTVDEITVQQYDGEDWVWIKPEAGPVQVRLPADGPVDVER